MGAVQTTTVVTSGDRFSLTLFLAIVVHAIIILGITFSPTLFKATNIKPPPLEITLVHQKSEQAPEKADYLAQADLEGGGNSQEKARPTSPVTTMVTSPNQGIAAAISVAQAPPQQQGSESKALTTSKSQRKINQQETISEHQKKPATAAELVQLSMEIANLSAEIDRSMQAYSEQLQHRYVSANTKAYRDAAYLDAWRAKIERIGNLNYPEEAKRRKLSGSLILDVALNSSGGVHAITVRRSSGQKLLDDAAVRIVKLAAPFAAFPEELRKDTDILHIIRSWQFLDNNRLSTSR